MATILVYAALGSGYQNAKIGNSDGTSSAPGTAPVIDMDPQYTDPRLNSFVDNSGCPKVDLCNRASLPPPQGPGIQTASPHWILPVPVVPAVCNDDNRQKGLDTIVNPYAAAVLNGFLYFIDFDYPDIQAVDMSTYCIIPFGLGGDPAYTFPNNGYQNCGVDLEIVDGVLYALFSIGESFAGPWHNSTVVKLTQNTSTGQLTATSADMAQVGANATGMTPVTYTSPKGSAAKTYLLVSAIGGTMGTGNGANSVISVVGTGADFGFIANPVVGTFAPPGSTCDGLDIRAIAATQDDSDPFVFILAGSYNSGWSGFDWTVRQTRASVIVGNALSTPPVVTDISGFTPEVVQDTLGTPGYFWTVALSSSGSGQGGKLVVGCGSGTGDQLQFYNVDGNGIVTDSGGAVVAPVIADSVALYGVTGCVLNTITLVPPPSSKVFKTLRSFAPHPVASGKMSMADFLAEMRKKQGK